MGNFFAGLWEKIKSSAGVIWHVIGGAITGSVAPTLVQSAMAGHLTLGGVISTTVTGVVGALFGFAQHSNNQQVAQAANAVTPEQQAAIEKKISDSVQAALVKAGVKVSLFLFLLTAPLMANPIGVPLNPGVGQEDDFVMAPIGALEFNPSNSTNYGIAFSESFGFAHVARVDEKHVSIDPYFFVGVFGAANIGDWVNSNGGAPWSLDYGFVFGLPKLDSTLPEVAFSETWNSINRGDAKLMINVAFPVDIVADVLCRKIEL